MMKLIQHGAGNVFSRAATVIVLALTILASGCSTFSAVGSLIDEAVGAAVGSSDAQSPKEAGAETNASGQGMFGGLASLESVMLFNVVYAQVLFFGGHDPGFDDFREGEGVTFEITGSDDSDQSSFAAERALLKRNADGSSWWFLGYRAEDENLEYEVLMDDEYTPLEIVWRDETSREIMRYTFNYGEGDEEPAAADEDVVYSDDFTTKNRVGRERITVGAGTFTAEHIIYTATDDTGATLDYDWWVADEVPGDLVKYVYRFTEDGEVSTISGELIARDDGYRTRMDAY